MGLAINGLFHTACVKEQGLLQILGHLILMGLMSAWEMDGKLHGPNGHVVMLANFTVYSHDFMDPIK